MPDDMLILEAAGSVRQSSRSNTEEEPVPDVYSRPCRGRAGTGRVQLGRDFVVGFDLEHLGEVVEIQVGPDCDMLQVAAIFGFGVTKQLKGEARTVAIPKVPSQVRHQAARVVLLERFLEVPVLRHHRQEWMIELVLQTSSLVESGLDTEDSLQYNLKRLAQHLGLDFNTGRRAALDDRALAEAISIGAAFLDPFEDEWIWYSDVSDAVRDLSDPSLDLLGEVDSPAGDPDSPSNGSSESDSNQHKDLALVGFRGESRDQDDTTELSSWRFPLYWNLIDEDLAPEDGAFRSAIEVTKATTQAPNARVTVECPSESRRPALYARIVSDRRVVAVGALLSDTRGWSGSIAMSKKFNSDSHHVEVMSEPTASRLDNHKRAECEQWTLLALAQDDAQQQSAYAWLQADLLSGA